jgi:hypothetical protein
VRFVKVKATAKPQRVTRMTPKFRGGLSLSWRPVIGLSLATAASA